MAETLEEPEYETVRVHDGFELRKYTTSVEARVQRSGEGASEDSTAFRRVAGYIFGANRTGARYAMTAPVSRWSDVDGAWLSFHMPAAHPLEELPPPNDSGIVLSMRAERLVAVVTFTGRTTAGRLRKKELRLRHGIEQAGYTVNGPPVLAVYDNPWTTLPFKRRNELHLEVQIGG